MPDGDGSNSQANISYSNSIRTLDSQDGPSDDIEINQIESVNVSPRSL